MERLFLFLFFSIVTISACNESSRSDSSEQNSTLSSWARSATLYEINTRQMTKEGTFEALKDHLPRIKSMGIDILWFMPIHPISMKNRKAADKTNVESIEDPDERNQYLGSPYAVANYLEINPDFGTPEDFKSLVADIHKRSMKVIIDWVPNHTGWDNVWITEHPEWYTHDKDGNITDPINPDNGQSWGWTDVADLNYDNIEMRRAMIDAMKYWVKEYNIDGFRVDVAHGVPNDFWDEVKEELLNKDKPLFMLAESETPYHRNSGAFHATYGWSFHHLMNDIAKGNKDVKDIKKWIKRDKRQFKKGFHLHFTSNHDENAWAGTVFERMGDAHKAMAVLSATLDGMPLVYSGQEAPMQQRLDFFKKDLIFWDDYGYAPFYKALFDLKHENRALRNEFGGDVEFISKSDKVLAFQREKNGDKVIVIINLSDQEQTYTLDINFEMVPDIFRGLLMESVSGEEREIGPWKYYVIKA